MATDKLAQFKTAIQTFYEVFKENNSTLTTSKSQQASNNIDAVNKLLDSLIGDSNHKNKIIDINTKQKTTLYSTESNTTQAMPSYNTRSPYMEIWINGIQTVPSPTMVDGYAGIDLASSTQAQNNGMESSLGTQLDINFEDLNLEMPMGGVESTITGLLTLYSRTPIEFLSFLTETVSQDGDAGLPVCRLRFGWNIARVDGQVERLLTPYLSFLVMNIAMSDPGKTVGAEFKLTLQDAGSAVLQNSSLDSGLLENWPQEQLRVILEKFLGLRLFTLDDLLTLGENEKNKQNLSLSPFTTDKKTYNEVLSYINSLQIDSSNGRTPLDGVTVEKLRKAFFNAYSSAKSAGASEEEAVRRAFISDKTFFVTNPTPALRINSNTLETVITSLVNKIACRWYPSYNTDLSNEVIASQTAETNIRELKRKFDSEGQSDKLLADFNEEKEKVASSCILIWVPFFPAGIYSSSAAFFGDISEEEGAFLLLPKVITDYSLSAASLPLIYGPGGSSLPYFYGGAQNVFARLTDTVLSNTKNYVNRVGEVLDISANYSNLIELMKLTYDEEMVYRETGKFLSSSATIKLTKEQKKSQADKQKEALTKELKKKAGGVTPEQFVKNWEIANIPKFKAIRSRFKQSIAPRQLVNNVEYSNKSTPEQSARSLAINTLKNRIGLFLNCPISIGVSLLGDPYLIRQGIGAFEIINYYPTMDGDKLKFNPFLSGVYYPTTITHYVSLGDYTTEVKAYKVPDKVKDSAKARIESVIAFANKTDVVNASNAAAVGDFQLSADSLLTIDLETLRTDEGSAFNVYRLNSQQATDFKGYVSDEEKRLATLTPVQQSDLISKYTTSTEKPDLAKVTQYALRDFEVSILQAMVDADPDLAQQSATTKEVLKQKIRAVHKQSTSAVGMLQNALGRSVTKNGTQVAGSDDMTKLELLYQKLQTSRYEDIRTALENQTKGK